MAEVNRMIDLEKEQRRKDALFEKLARADKPTPFETRSPEEGVGAALERMAARTRREIAKMAKRAGAALLALLVPGLVVAGSISDVTTLTIPFGGQTLSLTGTYNETDLKGFFWYDSLDNSEGYRELDPDQQIAIGSFWWIESDQPFMVKITDARAVGAQSSEWFCTEVWKWMQPPDSTAASSQYLIENVFIKNSDPTSKLFFRAYKGSVKDN